MKPKGHTSVMTLHAPEAVQGDTPEQALHRRLQFFPTPPWAARAGGELIKALDPQPGYCWEPCCGKGHMVHGLSDYFAGILRTDICNHGWDGLDRVQDFLAPERGPTTAADWIAFNPPFKHAAEFVRLGLQRARRGVACLIRMSWWDTEGRYRLFYGDQPCDVIAPFFDRVAMSLGKWEPRQSEPGGSTATAYGWFIWFANEAAKPEWLQAAQAELRRGVGGVHGAGSITLGIPPGTKDRLTHKDDARLFGVVGSAPLFEVGK